VELCDQHDSENEVGISKRSLMMMMMMMMMMMIMTILY